VRYTIFRPDSVVAGTFTVPPTQRVRAVFGTQIWSYVERESGEIDSNSARPHRPWLIPPFSNDSATPRLEARGSSDHAQPARPHHPVEYRMLNRRWHIMLSLAVVGWLIHPGHLSAQRR